jgi:hypothetical protein
MFSKKAVLHQRIHDPRRCVAVAVGVHRSGHGLVRVIIVQQPRGLLEEMKRVWQLFEN